MPKSAPTLKVEFKEAKSHTELGYTELSLDALPARLGSGQGLTLFGERFKVVDVRPGSRKDWLKKGRVVLMLEAESQDGLAAVVKRLTPPPQPVQDRTAAPPPPPPAEESSSSTQEGNDSSAPRVQSHPAAIPRLDRPSPETTFRTRCGFLPKPGVMAPSSDDKILTLLASDWRQIELVGKSEMPFLEAELDALRNSTEHYVRMAIKQPLASQFHVQEMIDSVFPGSTLLDGIVIQGEELIAEDSFAFRSIEGAEVYGTAVAGFVFSMGFRRFPTHAAALERLGKFMQLHELVLVQWVRGRVLTGSHFLSA